MVAVVSLNFHPRKNGELERKGPHFPKIFTIGKFFCSKMENSYNNRPDSPLEMHLELENVQSVIQLTKENIDALNERFCKFKPPPKIYLEEYQVRFISYLSRIFFNISFFFL